MFKKAIRSSRSKVQPIIPDTGKGQRIGFNAAHVFDASSLELQSYREQSPVFYSHRSALNENQICPTHNSPPRFHQETKPELPVMDKAPRPLFGSFPPTSGQILPASL